MNKKGLSGLLVWAVLFLIVAIVAGTFGLGLISGFSLTIARWFAAIFIVLFMISVIARVIKNA